MISPNTPIKDVIAAHPETREVFARHGLDTCCGGTHPVEMAARAHGQDLEALLAELHAAAAFGTETPVSPEMTVREAIARWPWTIRVFEYHGLTGCGGAQGPNEPIGFFATVHEVDPEGLLGELREAVEAGPPAAPAEAPAAPPAPDIYPRFLKAAILATLTGGATLGLVALTIAGLRGSLQTGLSSWTPVIQAHGHVQIFGWVALFIMGVAYHVVPRFKARDLDRPDLARRSFGLMAAGLVARSLAQPYMQESFAAAVGVLGAAAELAAILLFARVIGKTLAAGPAPEAGFERYLRAGTAWFVALGAANLATVAWMALARQTVIPPAADAAILHVEVVGFIGLWILGVSLRILPVFMGLRALGARASAGVFWAINLAVGLRVTAELGGLPVLRVPGALLELGAVAVFVHGLGIFRPAPVRAHADGHTGYQKFIRAAYAWLLLAVVMLAGISLVEALTGAALPRELIGSYRHAITVGFITAMIMGVAGRIVPVFRGVELRNPGLYEAAFWLLNAGCAIRVGFQAVAGFAGPPWTLLSAVSAYLEIPAVFFFGLALWRTLDAKDVLAALSREITLGSKVGDVLAQYPDLLGVFLRHGFTPLANPVLRRAMAGVVTIGQACGVHGVDGEALLRDLRAAAGLPPAGRRPVPLRVVS